MSIHLTRWLTVALVAWPISLAAAAPPTLTDLTPRGLERGKPVEVVLGGKNLTADARLLLPFAARQEPLPEPRPDPTRLRLRVAVAADVPLGAYPARVLTAGGVSGVQLLGVEAFPNVNEVEPNDTFEKAQTVPVPAVVSGQCAGGDVDCFRFVARKGQRLVLETASARLGSGVLPQVRVSDARRRLVAADDTQALQGDARLTLTVPADGEYVVELSDTRYRGGSPPFYRLLIAECDAAEEVFPLGGRLGAATTFTLRGGNLTGDRRHTQRLTENWAEGRTALALGGAFGLLPPEVALGRLPERIEPDTGDMGPRARDIRLPLTINGQLTRPRQRDHWQFPVRAGERYRFTVRARALGSRLDGVLVVTDQAGRQLALVDDVDVPPAGPGLPPTRDPDPRLDLTVPAGVTLLGVELRDQRGRGGVNFGYRLRIESARDDFRLRLRTAEGNAPRGGQVVLPVVVERRGYLGPIRLSVPDLPAGWQTHGGHIPAGAVSGALTLTAPAADGPPTVLGVRVEGEAVGAGPDGPPRQRASFPLLLNREGTSSPRLLPRWAIGLSESAPFALQGPAAIEVVQGFTATVPVNVTRRPAATAVPVEVSGFSALVPPPLPGQPPTPAPLTLPPVSVAASAGSATLTLTATPAAPEGISTLILQGKAKISNVDRLAFAPAVAVTVRRPFAVERSAEPLTLTPGRPATIEGRLVRQPVFKGPVRLQLTGLPAGVTLAAAPTALAADATRFTLPLQVAATAAPTPAPVAVTLTASTTLAGVAYVLPAIPVPVQIVKP